jgi:hypothetical protein
MPTKNLGGVERSLRELNFQENDRVPIAGGFICKASFLEKVARMGPFWNNPRAIAIEAYRRLGTDLIVQFVMPKRPENSTDSTTATNFSRRTDPSPRYTAESVVEHVDGLPSVAEIRRNSDSEAIYREFLRIMSDGQKEMGDMLWVPFYAMACRFMWYSQFGFWPYLLALARYPDDMEKLFRNSGEEARLRNKAIARAIRDQNIPPFLYFGEDICYNRGPMVPVRLLREVYFPHLKRAVRPLKDAGARIIWHSDGNILPILPDLLDCGIDGFQGFQAETDRRLEELAAMKSRSGRKLILWGSISVSSTLPFGSRNDVKREVERCIDAAAEGGGLFLSPSSSVGPEVPDENLLTMYRHTIEYGTKARS